VAEVIYTSFDGDEESRRRAQGPKPTELERLLAFIEFAQESTKLKGPAPTASVPHQGLFAVFEHQVQCLEGVELDISPEDSRDEIWLRVPRRSETPAPRIDDAALEPWVIVNRHPEVEPVLRDAIRGQDLIEAGTHRSSREEVADGEEGLPEVDPEAMVNLGEYPDAETVRRVFRSYVDNRWRPWSELETRTRKTIALYSELFKLKQAVEGGLVDTALELVWGIGLGIWKNDSGTTNYPLVSRLVELSLNEQSGAIEIRPRDVEARIELDWFAAQDNPGVAPATKAARELSAAAPNTFSPFDRSTWEPLLRAAVNHLDPKGRFLGEPSSPVDREPPLPSPQLQVTDTWVLFARPRTQSFLLEDLERLRQAAAELLQTQEIPEAIRVVVTDPRDEVTERELQLFRGVHGSPESGSTAQPRDLFFPKPYNEEQVRIVQLLESYDGVVVQGPPGTGKTHTIANIICHYLAEGKRVLVTSQKDPALTVLKEQLPEEIRALAVSLLTSEAEGLKQFEAAIGKIAAEVQGLSPHAVRAEIRELESNIDSLHGRLIRVDREIGRWAEVNLKPIEIDGQQIEPQLAAKEVVESEGRHEFLSDRLGISAEFEPRFANGDILELRSARRELGPDMVYLGCSLPQLAEFPELRELVRVHQDLSQFARLSSQIQNGNVPSLADSGAEGIAAAQNVLDKLTALKKGRAAMNSGEKIWVARMRALLRAGRSGDLLKVLHELGEELLAAHKERTDYIRKPVTVPTDADLDEALINAVDNLASGKSPFGLFSFGKGTLKERVEGIRVLNKKPVDRDDWRHVYWYLRHRGSLRTLAVRWNALGINLPLEAVPGEQPEHGLAAAEEFLLYQQLRALVAAEQELAGLALVVFPSWTALRPLADDPTLFAELERVLEHHLVKNRLSAVWATKERLNRTLEGKSGPVVVQLRECMDQVLGNPDIGDGEMQAEWSRLTGELARVQGVRGHLASVARVTELVESSGAPQYAAALRQPLVSPVDPLLPDDWREAWRLRRLATHLEAIDAYDALKRLGKERSTIEGDLAAAYQHLVEKRTWLKLHERATDRVRAALQAYLEAIKRIGKGTGKRAAIYRRDARQASTQASVAVPCWIMRHDRVAESLPPELGCFDLVIIDEASQSDLLALPAILRARKVLIVGDDKQVSPEAVGIQVQQVQTMMTRFLGSQVPLYRPQMAPDRSIYDLFKVVFARSGVMLREHFRCVAPIIEYSKREFYNHELKPLRIPKASERLDPPLIDVFIEDGYRRGNVNRPEAEFIVREIEKLTDDPAMARRSIGVVSLLADDQAAHIFERLTQEIGPEIMERHRIACGDARTFQGKERDIMFLSMVTAPNERTIALTTATFQQRFNVAASRARDRMYLVRSVELDELSPADTLRRGLLSHFKTPFMQDEEEVVDLRKKCESDFEREVFDELSQRGYRLRPQVRAGQYRIDLVVDGHGDARLAIECDGDRYHGSDKWADDQLRQRVLERAGWVFWRCFASTYTRRKQAVLADLLKTLTERGIEPTGGEGAPRSVHTELRPWRASAVAPRDEETALEEEGAEVRAVPEAIPQSGTLEAARPAGAANEPVRPVPREQRPHAPRGPSRPAPHAGALDFLASGAQVAELRRPVSSPDTPFSDEALAAFCQQHGLKTRDKRRVGGALWVEHLGPRGAIAAQLREWGFRLAPGKGYWQK